MKKYLLPILACAVLAACEEPKVTNPSDPRFDPMQFEFSDYQSHEELIPVLRVMFPPGTPKEYVEEILINQGGARASLVKKVGDAITGNYHNFGGAQKIKPIVEDFKLADEYIYYQATGKSWLNVSSGWSIGVIYNDKDEVIDLMSGVADLVHNSINNK